MALHRKYCAKALLFCLILFSVLPSCEQEKEKLLFEERPPEPARVDPHIAELLDSMNMYRFDTRQEAPPFTLTSVYGEEVSLSQYRGKVVLLSFWATW